MLTLEQMRAELKDAAYVLQYPAFQENRPPPRRMTVDETLIFYASLPGYREHFEYIPERPCFDEPRWSEEDGQRIASIGPVFGAFVVPPIGIAW